MPSKTGGRKASVGCAFRCSASVPQTEPAELSKLQKIIHLQEYEGYWKWTEDILRKVGLDAKRVQHDLDKQYKNLTGDGRNSRKHSRLTNILATILVGRYLKEK